MNKIMTPEEQRVWAYLLKNRKAEPKEIALNCDVTEEFASDMIVRIGTENWREEVPVRTTPNEGVKFDQGKARYDLLPGEFLEATAQVLTFGAKKYTVEAENEWQRLLLVTSADGIQLTTPSGCVVSVTRNTSGQPIPSLQSASVKIVETGKPETLIKSASWQSVEKMILPLVLEISAPRGSSGCAPTGLPKTNTMSYALKGARYAEQPNTCTLTIATPQGSLEVFFVPGVITGSDFWTTVWKGLSEHFGISRPQNKTGERNWEHGMKWGRPFAALMRHMWAWWGGEGKDPETGMSHLWHACACLAFLIAYEARGTGSDDRPNSGKEE